MKALGITILIILAIFVVLPLAAMLFSVLVTITSVAGLCMVVYFVLKWEQEDERNSS